MFVAGGFVVSQRLFLEEKAEFAVRTLGAELVGEVKCGACAGSYGGKGQKPAEGEEAGGLIKAETSAKLPGGGAEDAAAEGGVEGAETVELNGHDGLAGSGADGASTPADGLAGEQNLWKQTV